MIILAFCLIFLTRSWSLIVTDNSFTEHEERRLVALPTSEMDALEALYAATNGPDWYCCHHGKVAWDFSSTSTNPCTESWQGIVCNQTNATYHIVEIGLPTRNLVGTLPSSLGGISKLTTLDLNSNSISGWIPEVLCTMPLVTLQLSLNYLTGSIPNCLGNISSMVYLGFATNFLTGTLPKSLGNLTALVNIYLRSNSITGTIPASLGNCEHVALLYFEKNSLTGSLPSEFAALTSLRYLDIHSNSLTGALPDGIGNFSLLKFIDAKHNRFSGSIPSSMGNIHSLRNIYLSDNSLTGSIPSSLGNTGNDPQNIYFDTNFLTGPIPESLGSLGGINNFYLSDNSLTGDLPTALSGCTQLKNLFFDYNSLSGSIPSSWGGMNNLNEMYMNNNQLRGSLPSSLSELGRLQYLTLSENLLSGTIPPLSGLEDLVQLQLDHNGLTGSLDGVFSANASTVLTNIQVNSNQLSGTLPPEVFNLPALVTFVASINCFHGSLPSNICSTKGLFSLVLNGLSSATSCRNILFPGLSPAYILDFAVNGEIPGCLLELENITTLQLAGNKFRNNFPTDLALGPSLTTLDFSHNGLQGHIDSSVQHRQWSSLDLSYNRLSGSLLSDYRAQSDDSSLSLRNNRLSGIIPAPLLNMADISILVGNIFSCAVDHHDLPKSDDYETRYQCDSSEFNQRYYFWGAFCVATSLCVTVVWYKRNRVKFIAISDLLQKVDVWLGHSDPTAIISTPLVNLGRFFNIFLQLTSYCLVFILVILLPIYIVLNSSFGKYTHSYAYVASFAFMSGVVPFYVVLSCFIIFLSGILVYLFTFFFFKKKNGNLVKRSIKIEVAKPEAPVEETAMYTVGQTVVICIIFMIINLVVVFGANASYVIVVIYGSRATLLVEQLMISIFKLIWNMHGIPILLTNIVRVVMGRELKLGTQFSVMRITVALLNNILIPLIVVMAVSPDCFYNLYEKLPQITSDYTTVTCETVSLVAGACVDFESVQNSDEYSPPFTYDYQCSGSFITYYSSAYVIYCVISSFIAPVGKFLMLHIHKQSNPNTMLFKICDRVLPRVLKPVSKDDDGSGFVIGINRTISTLTTNFGLLLTFGVVFPPLAIAFSVSLLITIYTFRVQLGRFVSMTALQPKYRTQVEAECSGIEFGSFMLSIIWIVITGSCLFYTLFLFDTLGDAVGFDQAAWVLVLTPLLPLVMYVTFEGAKKCMSNQQRPHDPTVEMIDINKNPLVQLDEDSNSLAKARPLSVVSFAVGQTEKRESGCCNTVVDE